MICLGIEGTAEKTGVGIVDSDGKILSIAGKQLFPETGGIHPREAADHHAKYIPKLISEVIDKASLDFNDIDLVSFSRGPGLGPALRTVATASRTLALSLNVPIIGVNHCMAHIEIGKLDTGAVDPVSLYVSGGNSQIIAYDYGRYRIFGETLDIAIGNCLDHFGRETGLGHPGGPVIEKLAKKGAYVDLPYTVKGMDLSFSGLLSAAIRKFKEGIAIEDVCYSLQEVAFSMLVEITERALSHTEKSEVMLCGGVAANKRLRQMLKIMVEDHYGEFYMPKMKLCGDNGAMISWLGILMYNHFGPQKIEDTGVIQRFRTDEVDAPWVKQSNRKVNLPKGILAKGAESDIRSSLWMDSKAIKKIRIPKSYRIKEIDEKIRKSRTKNESKLISNVKKIAIRSPILYDLDLKEKAIVMEEIQGTLLKNLLKNLNSNEKSISFVGDCSDVDGKDISIAIGSYIGLMHKSDIIHGDLTSSNIIVSNDGEIVFIDFGLGKHSNLIEDKCVDLIVLKKSLQSVDYKIATAIFDNILDGYVNSYSDMDKDRIVNKIAEIQKRGRYTPKLLEKV